VSYKDIYIFVRLVQGHMTHERTNKLVLLLISVVYLCALRIAREACDLSTSACHLRLGCSAACVSAFYVATVRTTLFLLPCHRGHCFSCWYDIIFLFVFYRSSLTHKLQRKCACRSGGSYAARAFRLFRLGGWTSDASAKGNKQ